MNKLTKNSKGQQIRGNLKLQEVWAFLPFGPLKSSVRVTALTELDRVIKQCQDDERRLVADREMMTETRKLNQARVRWYIQRWDEDLARPDWTPMYLAPEFNEEDYHAEIRIEDELQANYPDTRLVLDSDALDFNDHA